MKLWKHSLQCLIMEREASCFLLLVDGGWWGFGVWEHMTGNDVGRWWEKSYFVHPGVDFYFSGGDFWVNRR
jgi:hypothetical protein